MTDRYKYSQETGADFKVNTVDKCDSMEDTNEIRQILDDLGELLGHSKFDNLYPEDETSGGYLSKINGGLDADKPATPAVNDMYLATDTVKIYRCFVAAAWVQVYPHASGVTKTGSFTAGRIVKISNASGIVEEGTNTDTDIADAVTKKHAKDSDAHLGTVDQDIPMSTHKFTGLKVPSGAGDSIRATTKITEANLEDAIDKKHAQNSDTHLGTVDQDIPMSTHKLTGLKVPSGVGDSIRATTKITEVNLEDSIDKKHVQGTDQKLDDGGVNEVAVTDLKANLINQVLTSGAAISWDMASGYRATLVAAHNFTIAITKLAGVLEAILIVVQDGTGSRVMDDIIIQKDIAIATTDVHADTEIIDIDIDIPTGARIRFKTSVADLPDPLVIDTIYYAIRISATEIKIAASKANAFAGTAINITDQGTGTHEVQQLIKWTGGTLGVLETGAGGEDIIKLHYKTSDEQWYAELISNFS